LVVAPHPDDESLGCGALIARCVDARQPVHLLFLTDGERALSRFIDPSELAPIRRREACTAATALGLDETRDVTFAGFPDDHLGDRPEAVTDAIAAAVDGAGPGVTVCVTDRRDPHSDHRAAALATARACRRSDTVQRLFEYPIWSLEVWPIVPGRMRGDRRFWMSTARARGGLEWVRHTDHVVDVTLYRSRKAAAISAHRSQLGLLEDAATWPTLDGVRDGAFMSWLREGPELFRAVPLGESPDGVR
jgi:LmbE family N-acetylglucosaminyl deacetylase